MSRPARTLRYAPGRPEDLFDTAETPARPAPPGNGAGRAPRTQPATQSVSHPAPAAPPAPYVNPAAQVSIDNLGNDQREAALVHNQTGSGQGATPPIMAQSWRDPLSHDRISRREARDIMARTAFDPALLLSSQLSGLRVNNRVIQQPEPAELPVSRASSQPVGSNRGPSIVRALVSVSVARERVVLYSGKGYLLYAKKYSQGTHDLTGQLGEGMMEVWHPIGQPGQVHISFKELQEGRTLFKSQAYRDLTVQTPGSGKVALWHALHCQAVVDLLHIGGLSFVAFKTSSAECVSEFKKEIDKNRPQFRTLEEAVLAEYMETLAAQGQFKSAQDKATFLQLFERIVARPPSQTAVEVEDNNLATHSGAAQPDTLAPRDTTRAPQPRVVHRVTETSSSSVGSISSVGPQAAT